MLNLALVSKTKLWYCDSAAASTPLRRHLSSHSSSLAPFPLTPFSLSGSTSACRSGYLIHVQRHRFPRSPTYCAREADQSCHTLGLDCTLPSLPPPRSLHPPSENVRYGGTLQTLPSGPTDNPPTKPQTRNTGGLDIAQPGRNNENKSRIHGLLFLSSYPSSSSTSVLRCSSCSVPFSHLPAHSASAFGGPRMEKEGRGWVGGMIERRGAEIFHIKALLCGLQTVILLSIFTLILR